MNEGISMKYQGMKDHFIDYISMYSDTFFAKKVASEWLFSASLKAWLTAEIGYFRIRISSPLNNFFISPNKKKSQGAKSGE